MTLRERITSAKQSIHPSLGVAAVAIVVLQATVLAVGSSLSVLAGDWYTFSLARKATRVLVFGAAVLATLPAQAGLYALLLAGERETESTLLTAARAVRAHYWRLLTAHLLRCLAAAAGGVLTSLLWFTSATVRRYARYLASETAPHIAQLNTSSPAYGMFVVFVAGFALVLSLTRRAGSIVVVDKSTPGRAWRTCLRVVWQRPATELGRALGSGATGGLYVLSLAALAISAYGIGTGDTVFAVNAFVEIVLRLAVGTVSLAVGVSLLVWRSHASVRRATEARSSPPSNRSSKRLTSRRLVIVAILVIGAVVGAGYVRTADLRTGANDVEPLQADTEKAYAVAAENTFDANRRVVYLSKRAPRNDSEYEYRRVVGVDYDDRELYDYAVTNGTEIAGIYVSEGVVGDLDSTAIAGPDQFDASDGNWTAYHPINVDDFTFDPRAYRSNRGFGQHPYGKHLGLNALLHYDVDADVNWTGTNVSQDGIIYRFEDRSAIESVLGPLDYDKNLTSDSHVVIRVDRDRAVLKDLTVFLDYRNSTSQVAYRIRFENVGSTDVQRPEGVGLSGPAELFWDVTYY